MPTNKLFRLHPKAENDLEDIYLYTYHEFGVTQADYYIRQLESAFQNLANYPGIARQCGDIWADLMAFTVGSHVVFFKTNQSGITVVRVLHQSMDYVQHL